MRCFIVIEGIVNIIEESNGIGHKIDQATAGEAIGEMAVLNNMPRAATLQTKGQARLLVIQGNDFRSLMQEYPAISDKIIQMLVGRLVSRTNRQPVVVNGF